MLTDELGGSRTAGARWFGDGRAPANLKDAASGATSINTSRHDLATTLTYGAIASMPVAQRARAEAAFQGKGLTAFREAMPAWKRSTGMKPEAFADRFFGRSADDPVVQALRDAAELAMTSTTLADMSVASVKAADAMQRVGPDRWSRFLADSLRRSMDRPATTDPKLSAIMDEMYRPNAKVGSGSTAAAVRAENATGQHVGGRWHTQKAKEKVIMLRNWLRTNPKASSGDRAAAGNVLRDFQNALAGK